jgi:catechol 2,3-dioxygenase-like lactoylglutathione lyase family enzyme
LLHLPGARAHTLELSLGEQVVELTAVDGNPGRAIPADSHSNDQWFQHVAIVVSDIDAAYAHLAPSFAASPTRGPEFYPTSPAPQTIPLSNPAAGGVRAFYFEDAARHDLELIWFPAGKGRPEWHAASPALFLGIDHSAIATSDTERSLGTYRDVLGLTIAGTSLNFGSEQEALSGVAGARVRITGLRGAAGPPHRHEWPARLRLPRRVRPLTFARSRGQRVDGKRAASATEAFAVRRRRTGDERARARSRSTRRPERRAQPRSSPWIWRWIATPKAMIRLSPSWCAASLRGCAPSYSGSPARATWPMI